MGGDRSKRKIFHWPRKSVRRISPPPSPFTVPFWHPVGGGGFGRRGLPPPGTSGRRSCGTSRRRPGAATPPPSTGGSSRSSRLSLGNRGAIGRDLLGIFGPTPTYLRYPCRPEAVGPSPALSDLSPSLEEAPWLNRFFLPPPPLDAKSTQVGVGCLLEVAPGLVWLDLPQANDMGGRKGTLQGCPQAPNKF